MFDGLDCCGFDYDYYDYYYYDYSDGDYDDYFDIAPGDTALCTECLCKGIHKLKKDLLFLK